MTNAKTAAGALSATIDLPVTDAARHVFDATATTHEIEAHIDVHAAGGSVRIWLAKARSAVKSALPYVEGHFADLEAMTKAETAKIETTFAIDTGGAVDKASAFAAGVAVASTGI